MTNQELLNKIEGVMNTEYYNLEVSGDYYNANKVVKFYPEPFFNFNENFIRELSPVVELAAPVELGGIVDKVTDIFNIEVYKTYVDYINEDVWKRL